MTPQKNCLYFHGDFTAIAASSAQFAVVPVSPGPDHVIICQTQCLGITAATGYINDSVTLQGIHLEQTQMPTSALCYLNFIVICSNAHRVHDTHYWAL